MATNAPKNPGNRPSGPPVVHGQTTHANSTYGNRGTPKTDYKGRGMGC